ncbi:hypothetical protein [Chondromyces crocatus]|uniref:hypothetical protein n=1 Tax=Chondromyces crocatus TaxID=52 RepID=UPI00067BE6FF|nr:hypothetical protein [Chondromyces crocatus]
MAALLALTSGGCGHAASGAFPTSASLSEARRKPDGVAIDPATSPPSPVARAEADEGLITLLTPLGVDVAINTVGDFFRRVVLEDSDGLGALLTRDAQAIVPSSGGQAQSPSIGLWWEQRFRRLDYGKLAGEPLYRVSELEVYRAEDAIEAPLHPAIQTQTLDDDDVLVRVPIITARVGADRLLGDQMLFWLRRDGARFRVYRVLEEFQLQ